MISAACRLTTARKPVVHSFPANGTGERIRRAKAENSWVKIKMV